MQKRLTAGSWVSGALAALAAMGISRAVQWLVVLHGAGWRLQPVPYSPGLLLGATLVGLLAWGLLSWMLSRAAGDPVSQTLPRIGMAFIPGCLGWIVPWLGPTLLTATSGFTFSKLDALRFGHTWVPIPPGAYLTVGLLGLGLMGLMVAVATVFWRHARNPWPAMACALFLAGMWRVLVFPPSGDEPYVLLTTSSLLHGGEMNLQDDFARGDGRHIHAHSFHEDFLRYHQLPGRSGAAYTFHGILLSALYLPGYAVAGRVGLQALLALGWVLLLTQLASALDQAGIAQRPARTTLALLAVASPLPYFAVFVGPDFPSALLMLLGVTAALRNQRGLAFLCIACLPWIHHKSGLLALGLAMGLAVLKGRSWGVPAFGVLLVSGAALVTVIAGAIQVPLWPPQSVMAFGADMHKASFSPAHVPGAILGLLFDRYRGVIYHPALYLTLAGIILMWRQRKLLVFLLACVAPYLALYVTFSGAGQHPGAPGRELVAVLPLAALPIGVAVVRLNALRWGTVLVRCCLGLGVLSLVVQAAMPALAFVSAKRRVEEAIANQLGLSPLAWLPDLGSASPGALTFLHAGVLAALLVAGSWWLVNSQPRSSRRPSTPYSSFQK